MPHRSILCVVLSAAGVALGCGAEPADDVRNDGAPVASVTTGGSSSGAAGGTDSVATAGSSSGESMNVAGPLDGNGPVAASPATGSGGSNASADAGSDGSVSGSDGGIDGSPGTGPTVCPAPSPGSSGQNPLFSDQYTADPAPLVHDCSFYITCGHDEGNTGFVLREWFVLSSTDMVNWTKVLAMGLNTFAWANANAWAGQMVQKDDKFYWYVPVNQRGSGMAIAVAVADSPLGPFTDAIGGPLIDDAFEMANWNFDDPGQTPYTIDPSVFIDDDGQAYLHYGGFGRLVVARLNADMISLDGQLSEVTPQGFFEAPFLTKQGARYYEVYASGVNPAAIDYATSTSPLGPWTYGGRILDPLPNVPGQDAATSHPGIAEFAGQWYLIYHLSNGPNNGGTYRREVAVDKLFFNPNGSIQRVTPSSGLRF